MSLRGAPSLQLPNADLDGGSMAQQMQDNTRNSIARRSLMVHVGRPGAGSFRTSWRHEKRLPGTTCARAMQECAALPLAHARAAEQRECDHCGANGRPQTTQTFSIAFFVSRSAKGPSSLALEDDMQPLSTLDPKIASVHCPPSDDTGATYQQVQHVPWDPFEEPSFLL